MPRKPKTFNDLDEMRLAVESLSEILEVPPPKKNASKSGKKAVKKTNASPSTQAIFAKKTKIKYPPG